MVDPVLFISADLSLCRHHSVEYKLFVRLSVVLLLCLVSLMIGMI
jgi:hypothetical protein